jgi:Tfp pilus tip-associated adhesin PilY1
LIGGLRGGGSQYFALDVTDPDDVDGTLPYPGLMWEFPDENDAGGDLAYMGETWGTPIITRLRLEVVDDDNSGVGYERWVAIVTGGYHPESDPNDTEVTGAASATYVDTSLKGRAIYILDLKTGDVLAQKKFTGNASDCPNADDADPEKNMCFAFVGSPAVLDLDSDGFADVAYFVDLGGQVFKWVLREIGEDRVNDASGLRTQPSWPFRRWFKAPVTTISGTSYYRNLFFPPAATLSGGSLWLAFGSGERLHIGYPGDGTDDDPDAEDENNRFYVMTDIDPYEQLGLGELDEGDLTDVTGNEGAASFNTRGYFFKAVDGEKFVTNVEIFVGDVIVASFTPDTGTDICTSRGDATLYAFNVRNGEGQFKDNANNPLRGIAIGSGLPTDPKISIGVGGQDTRIIIEKSGADFESEEGKDVDTGGRLLYWRER